MELDFSHDIFEDGGHDIISLRKVLLPGEYMQCLPGVYAASASS